MDSAIDELEKSYQEEAIDASESSAKRLEKLLANHKYAMSLRMQREGKN